MKPSSVKPKKRLRRVFLILLAVLAVLFAVCAFYVGNYYHADDTAREAVSSPAAGITVESGTGGTLVFSPEDPADIQSGLIFYPGGKVGYRAYAPLLSRLAENGVLCVLVKMPCNLGILDINAADGIQADYPEVPRWYIGGHSLGGVTAAMYLGKHVSEFDGLLLLGAYSTADFSDTGLSVLSVYGENDGVLSREKYDENLCNLPADFTEAVIPGGCHAYFGSYGAQKGDGTPTITAEEQQEETAELILRWMGIE